MAICRSSCFIYSILLPWIWACHRDSDSPLPQAPPEFETTPVSVLIPNSIAEASGIAASKVNEDCLWVHEDSGTPPRILLLKKDGSLLKSVFVNGVTNIDWEDMSVAKGPDASLHYIYLADIGDNLKARSQYEIYRFPEPVTAMDTVYELEKIRFRYPDGAHDAEAILVENSSKDIYIITKSDNPSRIYKLPYPQSTASVTEAVAAGELSIAGITGAAISADGHEVIIKTYPALSYFVRNPGESIEQAIKRSPVNLAHQLEPQGEAVAFAEDNSGFYTVSEKAFSPVVNLHFYKRK